MFLLYYYSLYTRDKHSHTLTNVRVIKMNVFGSCDKINKASRAQLSPDFHVTMDPSGFRCWDIVYADSLSFCSL